MLSVHDILVRLPTPPPNIPVAATVFSVHGGKGPTSTRQFLNFDLKIEGSPIDFEMGHFETQFLNRPGESVVYSRNSHSWNYLAIIIE